jgi:hypothetical protein
MPELALLTVGKIKPFPKRSKKNDIERLVKMRQIEAATGLVPTPMYKLG